MRRRLLLPVALAVLAPLLMNAEPAAAATTTKTQSCTDGGGHRWTAKAEWGEVYTSHGTRRVKAYAIRFTTKRAVKYVSYKIKVVDGSGRTVQDLKRDNRRYGFKEGRRYLSVNPENPPSSPSRTKIVLTVGDSKDGKGSCAMTFRQPGRATGSAPRPTAGACKPGKEVVTFKGQGSAGLGQYGQGDYDASAELWNVGGYHYAQTMGVCTHDAWYVDVKTDNSRHDGAVKAYPSMRKIYWDYSKSDGGLPRVSSFPRLAVTFGAKDPASCPRCVYDTAFDVWLNGIGNGSANELMIWTHNVGQSPYGDKVGSKIKIAGHTWDLYSGNANHYLAFVPTDTSNIASATFDLKDFTGYLIKGKRLKATSRLGQISYGVETVSTDSVTRRWNFTRFSVVDH